LPTGELVEADWRIRASADFLPPFSILLKNKYRLSIPTLKRRFEKIEFIYPQIRPSRVILGIDIRGYFSHLKDKIRLHRGLGLSRKLKLINQILAGKTSQNFN
jgi:hypothetical protein